MKQKLQIREAQDEDIPRLVELEQLKFNEAGMEAYDERFFRRWREVNPSGFLVSCQPTGEVVGYTYHQCVFFDFDSIRNLTTYDDLTDHGYTTKTHRADGNTIDGMSAVAVAPEGVYQIFKVIERQMIEQGRQFIITGSRIPGFESYWHNLLVSTGGRPEIDKTVVAAWYVGQCVTQFGGFLWESFKPPPLNLPKPTKPDPVMNKWLRHQGFGVAAVMPNWMRDRQSHDFGVLLVLRNTHAS